MGYIAKPVDLQKCGGDSFILVLTSPERRPLTELVKFELNDTNDWYISDRKEVWGDLEVDALTTNFTKIRENRPLNCWILGDKILLAMSRQCLIFGFQNLEKLKTVKYFDKSNYDNSLLDKYSPLISFASVANLAYQPE